MKCLPWMNKFKFKFLFFLIFFLIFFLYIYIFLFLYLRGLYNLRGFPCLQAASLTVLSPQGPRPALGREWHLNSHLIGQCPVGSVHCAVCTSQCALYSMQCAVCSVLCSVCNVQCEVWSMQCSVFSGHCAVAMCSVQCKYRVCNVQDYCARYSYYPGGEEGQWEANWHLLVRRPIWLHYDPLLAQIFDIQSYTSSSTCFMKVK